MIKVTGEHDQFCINMLAKLQYFNLAGVYTSFLVHYVGKRTFIL